MSQRVGKICGYEGCPRPLWSKGLCNPHYQMARRGDKLRPLRPYKGQKLCSWVECHAVVASEGLCSKHSHRLKKHGSPAYALPRYTRCLISGCSNKPFRSGMCKGHRARQRRFDLTPIQLQQILLIEKCSICGKTSDKLQIDHAHSCCYVEYPRDRSRKTCGKCVRGVVCAGCNIKLGVLDNLTHEHEDRLMEFVRFGKAI